MADDEDHAITDQLAGERDRLIGVAEVIAHDELDLWPSTPPLALRSSTAISVPR